MVVLEVAGLLGGVVADLHRGIEMALAGGPRGVVCDLSGVYAGAELDAVQVLATAGRHVRDWSGIPVAVVSPDPALREGLGTCPFGGHLIVTATMLPAVSAVLATPIPEVEWLRLAPHPTAAHASRNFVTRTLLRWGAGPLIPSAALVVSELVTNSTVHAGTDFELSIANTPPGHQIRSRSRPPQGEAAHICRHCSRAGLSAEMWQLAEPRD